MADGRASNGGARVGSGRKPSAVKKALQDILDEAVPDSDRKAIFQAMANGAKAGDSRAAALILGYLYGKPTERVELSGVSDTAAPISVTINAPMTRLEAEHDLTD